MGSSSFVRFRTSFCTMLSCSCLVVAGRPPGYIYKHGDNYSAAVIGTMLLITTISNDNYGAAEIRKMQHITSSSKKKYGHCNYWKLYRRFTNM